MTDTIRAARRWMRLFLSADLESRQAHVGAMYRMRLEHPHRATVRVVAAPARFQPCVPDVPITVTERVTYTGGIPILTWDPRSERWYYPL